MVHRDNEIGIKVMRYCEVLQGGEALQESPACRKGIAGDVRQEGEAFKESAAWRRGIAGEVINR